MAGLESIDLSFPWVITSLDNRYFALSSKNVQTMVFMPECIKVPEAQGHVRGMVNIRGKVMPMLDLRVQLGMRSLMENINATCAMLEDREQEHRVWIDDLTKSIEEDTQFASERDPDKCKFGLWYASYRTDNIELSSLLEKFDQPHRRIHSIANEVDVLRKKGDVEKAFSIIESCKNKELAEMIRLFEATRRQLLQHTNEIAVVVESSECEYAIAVDAVESVEFLKDNSIEKLTGQCAGWEVNELASWVGRRRKDDQFVLLLDNEKLIETVDVPDLETA